MFKCVNSVSACHGSGSSTFHFTSTEQPGWVTNTPNVTSRETLKVWTNISTLCAAHKEWWWHQESLKFSKRNNRKWESNNMLGGQVKHFGKYVDLLSFEGKMPRLIPLIPQGNILNMRLKLADISLWPIEKQLTWIYVKEKNEIWPLKTRALVWCAFFKISPC